MDGIAKQTDMAIKKPAKKAKTKAIATVEPEELPNQELVVLDDDEFVTTPQLIKYQIFVNKLLEGFSGAESARLAGYEPKHAKVTADKLMKHPVVSKMIADQGKAIMLKIGVTHEKIWGAYAQIAFSDPGDTQDAEGRFKNLVDMPENLRMAVSSIKIKESSFGSGEDAMETVEKEIKFHPKLPALDKLAELSGLVKRGDENNKNLGQQIVDAIMEARLRVQTENKI